MKRKILNLSLAATLFIIACSKENPSNVPLRIPAPVPVVQNGGSLGTNSTKGTAANATITGIIQPIDAKPVLTLFNPKFYTDVTLNNDGSFKIDSLQDGLYNLLIKTIGGYKDTVIINIQAKQNHTYDLEVIRLSQ